MIKIWVLIGVVSLLFIGFGCYIGVKRYIVEKKIDAYVEQYGIPHDQITKADFSYNLLSGNYEKHIWTKQDGDDIFYLFYYRGLDEKKIILSFVVYGNEWIYYENEEDMREFQLFLSENNWNLHYYPPISHNPPPGMRRSN